MTAMLHFQNISTGYGNRQVLFNVSFEIKPSEIVHLNGGNGSGKSTILRCIYGLNKPWNPEGKILFSGEDITDLLTHQIITKGIIYLPQKNKYFEDLSVLENIKISGTIYNSKFLQKRIEYVYAVFPVIKDFRNRTPFNLSGGERQLLSFGMALIHNPKLILFDEPYSGLDSDYKLVVENQIRKMNVEDKIGFLIVEHIKDFVNTNRRINIELGKVIQRD